MTTKHRGRIVWYISFVAVIVAGSVLLHNSLAQNRQSVQSVEISPPTQELDVIPGNTHTIRAKIRNTSDQTLPISVRLQDFTASGEEGQIALVEKSNYAITQWSSVLDPSFTLKPGETKEVEAVLNVPDNAAGGRYGSFVFTVGGEQTQGTNAALAQEVASLFLVRIQGEAQEQMFIQEFRSPRFLEFGPVQFSIKLRNEGNVHVKTQGLVNVTDMFGNRVTDIVVKPTNIFPDAVRILTPSLDKKLLFGQYKATAILYYGEKNETLVATTTFLAVPVRILIGIAIVLFILFKKKKHMHKALHILLYGK